MKNNERIYAFLRARGFELIEKDTSAFFGDYYDIFTNDSFQLRFGSSKSFETVDIRSNQPNESWYDMGLVKALLYNERRLNKVTGIEVSINFLQKNLDSISELFNNKNYHDTKKSLEELGNERAKQMFPGIRK